MLAQRLGKRRIVAETGAGQHGVATATVCARFGFECVVYMGEEDMRRQRPNVERMRLLGAEVRGVDFGTKTLKEATSEAIRDWITNVETTHYLIGSCVGPAPYPELVAELQSVIGREAREQLLAVEGRLPEAVVACVGGGSNAIGIFHGFVEDEDVRLVGVEAAGAASLGSGRPGVLHGARSSVLADEDGQIADAHSISAGLDYPGRRPRARLPARHGPRRVPASRPTRRRSRRSRISRATEGILPALEPAHALARARDLDADLILVGLSGPRRQGPRRGARHVSTGKQLVIYLVAEPETPELARAAVEGGADLIELGFPFSDPLAEGPVIRRASERALARGMRTHACLDVLARRASCCPRTPLLPMTYAAILEAYGYERFAADARDRGASSFILVDLPVEDQPALRRIQLVAPTSTDERIRAAAEATDGWLYLVSVTGTTGARTELSPALPPLVERVGPSATSRSTPASASPRPSRREAGELADGVVVGSRAVQVAEEGPRRCATTSLAARRPRRSAKDIEERLARAAFPELDQSRRSRSSRPASISVAVETADGIVFRIPRQEGTANGHTAEHRLLPLLAERLPARIPLPEVEDRAQASRFPVRRDRLPQAAGSSPGHGIGPCSPPGLGGFLTALHSTSLDVEVPAAWPLQDLPGPGRRSRALRNRARHPLVGLGPQRARTLRAGAAPRRPVVREPARGRVGRADRRPL